MFQNSLMAGAAGQGGFYDYQIDQSLRFNDDDSAYLSRTPAGAGNRKTWTWSGWVKRGNLGVTQGFFQGFVSALNLTALRIPSDNTISIQQYNEGSFNLIWKTQAVFRDPSAWYHIVVSFDSTEASSSNSVKMYVNGNEQSVTFTAVGGSYVQNRDSTVNSVTAHNIGRYVTGNYFDGYMAEVNFIDGTALDATSFGEFKSGVWVPKEYTGSYGTNGFYLSFADSAAIGDDLSGNGNDWTPSGLASTDVMLDSPTNNYCTFNPINKSSNPVYSEGNLKVATSSTVEAVCPTTFGVSSGKWYFEYVHLSSDATVFGIITGDTPLDGWTPSSGTDWAALNATGAFQSNTGSAPSATSAFSNGDIIGAAFDLDANEIEFFVNGSSVGTITGITSDVSYFPFIGDRGALSGRDLDGVANFGQDSSFAGNKTAQGNTDDNGVGDFYYSPPSGYLALCTANLPEPTITPALDDVPADYFNTVLYTGNLTTGHAITGVGFQPDWVWIKNRTDPRDHVLTDAVRGATIRLESNTTDAEVTQTEDLQSFDADGFTVGAQSRVNESGDSFVAWNWLAGNGTASNTDGSITSTVSVNQKAGFSIVSYTGTGANATVGHGLGSAPKMVIVKRRDAIAYWPVYSQALCDISGQDYTLSLNTTDAQDLSTSRFQGTAPTSSVFSVGTSSFTNASSGTYIAYCFAEVEGFSKFGSYTGNGSTDGPFVYCGFRPAWVLIKRTDTTGDWVLKDAERPAYNTVNLTLIANNSNAEAVNNLQIDFTANGFKWRDNGGNGNASGGTYIFAAFAEIPVKYSGTMAR